jgi:hypothetical protein
VTWLAASTLVSRATNLPQLPTIAGSWRFCQPAIVKILPRKAPESTGVYPQSPWDVSSQDSSIISKIASMSASDTGDFLRLARSWLRVVAASGANFSESVAAGAEFCLSSESFASISSRSARSVSSCDQTSTNSCSSDSFSLAQLPNCICNR